MTKEQRQKLFEALDAFCMREYEEHIVDEGQDRIDLAYTNYGDDEGVSVQVTLFLEPKKLQTLINGFVVEVVNYPSFDVMLDSIEGFDFDSLVEVDEDDIKIFSDGYVYIDGQEIPTDIVSRALYEKYKDQTNWSAIGSFSHPNDREKDAIKKFVYEN